MGRNPSPDKIVQQQSVENGILQDPTEEPLHLSVDKAHIYAYVVTYNNGITAEPEELRKNLINRGFFDNV